MSIPNILWLIIGIVGGGILGVLCGLYLADEHWKLRVCPYCDHDSYLHARKSQHDLEPCCNTCVHYNPRMEKCTKNQGCEQGRNRYHEPCSDHSYE